LGGESPLPRVEAIRPTYSARHPARARFGKQRRAPRVKTLCIEWPSGVVQELQNIPAKQMITVIEPHLQGAFDDTGAFRIAVTCDNHRSYGIEVSTDLVEWTNVANFAAGSGVYTEDAPHTQRRFYRLR
jgi:hypothetical protein